MTTKRTFGVQTTDLATETPLLTAGIYAGVITGAAVVGKEGKQHIVIGRMRSDRWDKSIYDEEKQRQGMFPYIGAEDNLEITGTIYFGATLNSKSAVQQLQQDEPKVFGGQIRLKFDMETLTIAAKTNPTYANWVAALGLDTVAFTEQVDFEYDDNIEVPEEWAHIPNIVDILNSLNYQRAYFSLVCETANNLPCKVDVLRAPRGKNSTVQENSISTGSFNNFAGVLTYVDGCEDDLND
jgi:hypothetical protein